MSKDHEIRLSAEAEQILNSETFKQAISNLKEEYIQHWLNNRNIDDVDFREDLHKAVLLLPEIERIPNRKNQKNRLIFLKTRSFL